MKPSTLVVLLVLALPAATAAQEAPGPSPIRAPTDPTDWIAGAVDAEARVGAAVVGPAIDAKSVAAFFDAAFHLQSREHALVGAVVSVVYEGEVLFQRGYGWGDLEKRVPADPEKSLFRIASITKPFVWTAIMQLVEQGRVSLEADVNDYLDFEVPATFDEPVRVWHLLSHTPGFEETWTGWAARDAGDVGELGRALQELMPARVRPPGLHAAYSNYGAALAGYIVERVTGRPWAEYVEDHILAPLGMSSTNARVEMPPELRLRHAAGYVYQDGRFLRTDFGYLKPTPAGIMSSTAADMAAFMMAHLGLGALGDARILQESTAALMHSPLFQPHEKLLPILHGFYRSDQGGQIVFGHGGDTNQFHSDMRLMPEVGLGVFVSYNSDPGAAARSNVVAAFIDHFFPTEHLRPAPEPFEQDLSDYVGEYVALRSAFSTFERVRTPLGGGAVISEGDGLRINASTRLVAVGPDQFTGLYGDAVIVFERDEQGEVTHMIAGSPLSTLKRASTIEGRAARYLAMFVMVVSLAASLMWGYRLFRPLPEQNRLPSPHVRLGWLHAVLMAVLAFGFFSFVGATPYGVPLALHAVLLAYNANLVLGLVVIGLSIRQWAGGYGGFGARAGYALVALAAAANIWLAWSFNLVGYLL